MSSLIPTHASAQITEGLAEYLTTTFALSEDLTAQQLRDFLMDPENGMFYGPYVRTRLPYAPAQNWAGVLGWLPEYFQPYHHQAEAFRRLSSLDPKTGEPRRPEPTLVVTGTGSGKTESFLYPILDHCRRVRSSGGNAPGIKALIMYPMNALAADQERRLAQLLSDEAALAGVTAGLYTGEVSSGGRRTVSENGLITDRAVIRDTPPDILLTNYKMLDQLLLRPEDAPLWEKSAESLQYLVLDEFHSYDAAQGTDVAMLLRRLGLKLKQHQPEGFLTEEESARPLGRVTPVATSATLGGKDAGSEGSSAGHSSGRSDMLAFAYTVFGERLSGDAIVGETILDVQDWQATIPQLTKYTVPKSPAPERETIEEIVNDVRASTEAGTPYADAVHHTIAVRLWGPALGTHAIPSIEASIAAMADNPVVAKILEAAATPIPLDNPEHGAPGSPDVIITPLIERVFTHEELRGHRELYLEFLAILLSEIAYLRAAFGAEHGWNGKKIPGVETHLWVREISRIDRAVGSLDAIDENASENLGGGPRASRVFRWSDDGVVGPSTRTDASVSTRGWLPAIYCRRCGRSGWMFAAQPGGDSYEIRAQEIRKISITSKELQRPLIDATSEVAFGEFRSEDAASRVKWLNLDLPGLLDEQPETEMLEESPVAPVLVYAGEDVEERAKKEQCPSCGEDDAIRYLGSSVATLLSVTLSNLYGMDELDAAEKKTLVFTDSVQDAAHRAGFVQNRARAFALRSRMWRAVVSLAEDREGYGSPVPLSLMSDRIIEHAKQETGEAAQDRALFELLPSNLKNSPRYSAVWDAKAPAKERQKARTNLRERINFDLALHFGDRVDLPRSLVNTGTLTVGVDVDNAVLLEAAKNASQGLIESPATDQELLAWARGTIEYMRISGGVDHVWLKEYLREDCNPYLLNRREARSKGVPGFPPGGSPKFPRTGPALKGVKSKRNNSATMSVSAQQGWYARWTKHMLSTSVASGFDAANHATVLFQQLEYAEVLRSYPTASGGRVYALSPANIVLQEEEHARVLECPICRLRVGLNAHGRAAMNQARCFTLSCTGRFTEVPVEDNYYKHLYRSKNTRTIVSAEHTGLIDTKLRKQIEDQFKLPASQQPADAPNVLVATPTLEMGIDIGDLSTVMLSSMPATVASYVQRVGRAGRLSGNSLIIALVRGRGRALTKLEHPLETIAGAVTAPAAYLSARDIIHRQFLAYVLDTSDVLSQTPDLTDARGVFSSTDGPSLLDAIEEAAAGGFEDMVAEFSATIAEHTTPEVLEELAGWAGASGGLIADIQNARQRWVDTYHSLLKRQQTLEHRHEEIESHTRRRLDQEGLKAAGTGTAAGAGAADNSGEWISRADLVRKGLISEELLNESDANRAALIFVRSQLKKHTQEYWIGALERYGLLPNFTLLDDTVEFDLSVRSFSEEKQAFESQTYNVNRGISSALTELAPGNTFYFQGVGARIDSVEMGEHHSALTQWRLCPECSYSEPTGAVLSSVPEAVVPAPAAGACPSCGSLEFADRDQLVDVVEMTKVYATVDAHRSAISDAHDDRTSARFSTQLSFNVPEGGTGQAWYLTGTGFGMEYLQHVDMRWLNLGRVGGGPRRMFAHKEREVSLFRVCEACGHLDSLVGSNHWYDHAAWCKHRHATEEHSINFALGRSLGTQGVLIHLPAMFGVMESTTLPSLIAALKLGFKEYLGGNPDHLDVEPVRVESDGIPIDMLLVHDTIPGGTGYLAQFTRPEHVRQLFEVTYQRLTTCHCRDEERLACPSCLLPFARSSEIQYTSRSAAVAVIGKILADDLHIPADTNPMEQAWDATNITTRKPEQTHQSKLELRFIEQLREDLQKAGANVYAVMNGNYANWTITFPSSPHVWSMKEQVNLGRTIPDVVFSTPDPEVRDIAVYLDGAAFHASEIHNRVADDFRKRNELHADGYLPWTLTWEDLETRQAVARGESLDPPIWGQPDYHGLFAMQTGLAVSFVEQVEHDSFTLLLAILRDPTAAWDQLTNMAFFEAVFDESVPGGTIEKTHLQAVTMTYLQKERKVSFDAANVANTLDAWRLFVGFANLTYLRRNGIKVEVLDPAAAEASRDENVELGEAAVAVEEPAAGAVEEPSAEPAAVSEAWVAVLEEYEGEDDVLTSLNLMLGAGLPGPDEDSIGDEINGIPVVAAWPGKVVLLFADSEPEDAEELTRAGYSAYTADFETLPPELAEALS
ncbi:DEAD/DEAH box helicase [Pseudoglutamicibacter cumminsii]|uniref:DEAD/DEAH box helicase n=1 Tax=Pseudoglutamicibacter cumminsii TaxID=156979 RepID=A0AAP4C8E5_9MICC|nr:DEAD/DEAH box helicase [Pseudoglutamicibacter cumminsii]MDK6275108.1 DEAD/DEAH box helicase [Pseudoglutamicibacter cumminsii]